MCGEAQTFDFEENSQDAARTNSSTGQSSGIGAKSVSPVAYKEPIDSSNPAVDDEEDDEAVHFEPPAVMHTGSAKKSANSSRATFNSSTVLPDDDSVPEIASSEEFSSTVAEDSEEESVVVEPTRAEPVRRPGPPMPAVNRNSLKPIDITPPTYSSPVSIAEGSGMALMLPPKAQWDLLAAILQRCEIKVSSPADRKALEALGINLLDAPEEQEEPVATATPAPVYEEAIEEEAVEEAYAVPVPQRPQRPAPQQRQHNPGAQTDTHNQAARPAPQQRPVPQQRPNPQQRPAPQQRPNPQQRQQGQYQNAPARPYPGRQPAPQQRQQPPRRPAPQQPVQEYNYDDYSSHSDDDYYSDVVPVGDTKKKGGGIDKDTLIKCIAVGLAATIVVLVIFILLPRL